MRRPTMRMRYNEYRFESEWLLQHPSEEVAALLEDVQHLQEWNPEVCSRSKELAPVGERRHILLVLKGLLGMRLRLNVIARPLRDGRLEIDSSGDLVGDGAWILSEEGASTRLKFVCHVFAASPFLKFASALARPLCKASHRHTMRLAGEGIARELGRRQRADKPLEGGYR